jgi:hypothetical protein
MGPTPAALGTAICLLVSSSPVTAQTVGELAQQGHVETATTSSNNRNDACTASTGKAFNLCIIRGFANITSVNCDCTQHDGHGAPPWECVATATCKK